MKVYPVVFHFIDQACPGIRFRIVAVRLEVQEPWNMTDLAKAAAQIRDEIAQLVIGDLVIAHDRDLIIRVLDVPVVQQGHHYLHALKLSAADKGIFLPLPAVDSFDTLWSQPE